MSSVVCRALSQSGHYLKYFEKKESRESDANRVKGTIDVRKISEMDAAKDGAIAIIMSDGGKIKLKAPSEQSAALWVVALEGARAAAAGAGSAGDHGPESDEVLKATMAVSWLLVEGNDDDEQQRRLMGRFELVPGRWVCGRGVWQGTKQGQGQGRRYLYYSRGAEWVLGDREEDMETGAKKGLAKVGGGSKALTPCHAATSGWLILVQEKAAAWFSSTAHMPATSQRSDGAACQPRDYQRQDSRRP